MGLLIDIIYGVKLSGVNKIKKIINKKYNRFYPNNARHDDVYIVEFPKSGVTWLSTLIANVNLLKSEQDESVTFYNLSQYIPDIHTSKDLAQLPLWKSPKYRFIKSHDNYNKNYSFVSKENHFFYFEDEFGGIKLPRPNVTGEFQLENISTAITTARQLLDYKITDDHIKKGITKIESIARLQEIKSGKLKDLIKNNQLFVDGSHNPLGAKVLNQHLESLNCKKHIILGMMANKNHNEYVKCFKNIETITTIDIPNQLNAIKGKDLKKKIKIFKNIKYKNCIKEAISSLIIQKNDIIIITGSLYLAGEVLNLN